MSLHDDIMNIPCPYSRSCFPDEQQLITYKEGHRDARHAAAELVIEADRTIEELRSALCDILAAHANDNIRPKAFYIAAKSLQQP